MLKKLMVQMVMLVGFISSANAGMAMQLKDISYKTVGEGKLEVTVGGGKILVEKSNETTYKINSQPFEISKNDTFEQMQRKMEKAYNASKKKGSALNGILMPEAHAMFNVVMGALLGGVVGMAVGNSMCSESSDTSSGYQQ